MSGKHRIEMHAHTAMVSPCGRLSPGELVDGYVRAGYSALVITDHLVATLPIFDGVDAWSDRVHRFFSGFRAVRAAASGSRLVIFPGFELSFAELPGRDFLVYGIDEAMLGDVPHPYSMDPASFSAVARESGALVFQAHPFRNGTAVEPGLLDGIEVQNGNPRHDSRNDLAEAYAATHRLLTVGGSDAHRSEDIARGGITLPEQPESLDELLTWWRSDPGAVEVLVPCDSADRLS